MTERKPLPLGIDDFKHLIEGGYVYVDKSLLIHELLTTGTQAVLIPRMRRFGKTLNMSMLRYFFEKSDLSNAHLFEHLAIRKKASSWAQQGKYPVILLTLKEVQGKDFEDAMASFRLRIAEEFRRHHYLADSPALLAVERRDFAAVLNREADDELYTSSLRSLSHYLHRHYGQKAVILIDEYDAPVHNAYNNNYYGKMMDFVRPWLSAGLKTNLSLQFGVVTGILRIAKESLFSGLNNVIPYTVFDRQYSEQFGFLEHEVTALLKEYGLSNALGQLRQWYNGYRIGKTTGLYNPWSVLRCIANEGDLQSYWIGTGNNALLKKVIREGPNVIKSDLEALLSGGTIEKIIDDKLVFPDLMGNDNVIWALLLFSGYLTLAAPAAPCTLTQMRIPNEEVRGVFTTIVREWFEERQDTRQQYCQMLDAVATGNVEAFERILQHFVLSSVSSFDTTPEYEAFYHALSLGMLVGLTGSHIVRSNPETGLGRCDIMVQPHDKTMPGTVIEIKHVEKPSQLKKAAAAALEQIANRQYATELRAAKLGRIIEIGIAFCGKQVAVSHRVL